jgi:hypothetical protein
MTVNSDKINEPTFYIYIETILNLMTNRVIAKAVVLIKKTFALSLSKCERGSTVRQAHSSPRTVSFYCALALAFTVQELPKLNARCKTLGHSISRSMAGCQASMVMSPLVGSRPQLIPVLLTSWVNYAISQWLSVGILRHIMSDWDFIWTVITWG